MAIPVETFIASDTDMASYRIFPCATQQKQGTRNPVDFSKICGMPALSAELFANALRS